MLRYCTTTAIFESPAPELLCSEASGRRLAATEAPWRSLGFMGFSCFNGGKSWHLMGFNGIQWDLMGFHSDFMAFPMACLMGLI